MKRAQQARHPLKPTLSAFIAKLDRSCARKHKDLRDLCKRVLDQLKNKLTEVHTADAFFEPFRLGCETKTPKVMKVSLEAIQKLVAGGYLTGNMMVGDPQNPLLLIDVIVHTVCRAAEFNNEDIQLEVIRTLLAMGTRETCEIHQRSLMRMLEACYSIYLNSKNRDIKTSAVATLTQTISILFDRMEKTAAHLKTLNAKRQASEGRGGRTPTSTIRSDPTSAPPAKTPDYQMPVVDEKAQEGDLFDSDEEKCDKEKSEGEDENEEEDVSKEAKPDDDETTSDVEGEGEEEEPKQEEEEVFVEEDFVSGLVGQWVQAGLEQTVEEFNKECVRRAAQEKNRGNILFKQEKYEQALSAYQKAFSFDPSSPVYFVNQSVVLFVLERWDQCIETCHRAMEVADSTNPQHQALVAKALSTLGSVALTRSNIPEAVTHYKKSLELHECPKIRKKLQDVEEEHRRISQMKDPRYQVQRALQTLETDVSLVFTYLCTLANKPGKDDKINIMELAKLFNKSSDGESVKTKTKTLSLRLLQTCLDSCGPHAKEKFMDVVRESMMPALYHNIVSTKDSIFGLALNLFLVLVKKFRKRMKKEIGVIMDSLVLKIAKSSNASFEQKKMLMQKMHTICKDPPLLVSLFLNYDCGGESTPNVFKDIIHAFEKTIFFREGKPDRDMMTPEQERALRQSALAALVQVLESLVTQSRTVAEASASGKDGKSRQDQSEKQSNKNAQSDVSSLLSADNQSDMFGGSSIATGAMAERDNEGVGSTTSGFAQTPIQRYELQEKIQKASELGVVRFNMKPKDGINYLVKHKVLTKQPESIARFLLNTPQINKIKLGEYLGGRGEFNAAVLRHFIFGLEFADVPFDDALRHLCTAFRPPGEAQMVDRIMERFAERYTLQNPENFPNADAAMTLSFAVMMLNTDAHSSNVKRKMTKDDFITSIRKCYDENDLATEQLSEVYDSVVQNEIHVDWNPDLAGQKNLALPRVHKFAMESHKMLQNVESAIGQPKVEDEDVYLWPSSSFEENREVIRHMYSACWMSVLATLGTTLEQSSSIQHAEWCLKGMRLGIRLSSLLDMEVPREAFVTSIARATLLGTWKRVEQKNIMATKLLFQMAYEEAHYMRKNWAHVFQVISDFELLKLQIRNEVADTVFFKPDSEAMRQLRPKAGLGNMLKIPNARRKQRGAGTTNAMKRFQDTHEIGDDGQVRLVAPSAEAAQLASLTDQVDPNMIDRLFGVSTKLSGPGIDAFVTHLAETAMRELGNEHEPRVFSLQKVVEVCDANMNRVRVEWQNIWRIVIKLFCRAGCHTNSNVSMYAIDSLKQLSSKFLEKDELSNFRFQSKFLQPFEAIMEHTKSSEIRELVVRCMARIIQGRHENVKSGWRVVFTVLARAARDSDAHLLEATHEVVSQILDVYFPLIQSITSRPSASNQGSQAIRAQTRHLRTDALTEAVKTLTNLSQNPYTDYSLAAIDNLSKCAQYLFESDRCDANSAQTGEPRKSDAQKSKDIGMPGTKRCKTMTLLDTSPDNPTGEKQEVSEDKAGNTPKAPPVRANSESALQEPQRLNLAVPAIKAWYLCLKGLSRLVRDPRLTVRSRSLNVLYKLLHIHGAEFDAKLWAKVYHELLHPIFRLPLPPTPKKPVPKKPQKIKSSPRPATDLTWLNTTCFNALSQLTELFAKFYEPSGFLLRDLLEMLNMLIAQTSFELSKIAIQCRTHLVELLGERQDNEQWTTVLKSFANSLGRTLHFQPLHPSPAAPRAPPGGQQALRPPPPATQAPTPSPPNARPAEPEVSPPAQAALHPLLRSHLLILTQLRDICVTNGQRFTLSHWQLVLNACTSSREAAKSAKPSPTPDPQGSTHLYSSTRVLLELLFGILQGVSEKENPDVYSCAEDRLMKLAVEILDDYSEGRHVGPRMENVVCFLLERVLKTLSDSQFRVHLKTLFPFLARLVNVDSKDVRYLVFGLLMQRVAPCLP